MSKTNFQPQKRYLSEKVEIPVPLSLKGDFY